LKHFSVRFRLIFRIRKRWEGWNKPIYNYDSMKRTQTLESFLKIIFSRALFIFALMFFVLEGSAAGKSSQIEVDGKWYLYKNESNVTINTVAISGKKSVKIGIPSGGEYTFAASLTDSASLYDEFNFKLYVPENLPGGVELILHIKDVDFWWYQKLLPDKAMPGKWNEFRIAFNESESSNSNHSLKKYNWTPKGHFRPFDLSVIRRMREIGLTIIVPKLSAMTNTDAKSSKNTAPNYEFILKDAYFNRASSEPQELCISNLDFPKSVPQYEKFEANFELSRYYSNPFDPDVVDVTAHFTAPSGKQFTYPCFYFQNYIRRRDGEYEKLIPAGAPLWKLRIAPTETGEYSFWITVSDNTSKFTTPKMKFNAASPLSKGFVRISPKDPLFFEFNDGSFFYPIGLSLHCTYDDRYHSTTLGKNKIEVRDHPGDKRTTEGGFIIDRRSYVHTDLFKKMHDNGMNATEIWFASWGYEIEWRGDWRGYAGINQYNMENAWRLDLVMESACENDIYFNLVLHCHGQFGEGGERGRDGEFDNHPYNRSNGGFLRNPIQIFYEDKAFTNLMKRLRYIVARYGYSRNIFGWEIISETDLTAASVSPASRNFVLKYTKKLKEMDIHNHPVTNHYSGSYMITDDRLMKEPSMDFVTGDAYRGWAGQGAPFHFPPFYELLSQTSEYWNKFKKPGLVTECGCCWFGGTEYALFNDVHQVCWATWMTHLAGTSLFWWFEYVDTKDLYWHYKAFAKFVEGEDRRGRKLYMGKVGINTGGSNHQELTMTLLTNEQGGYAWIYDNAEFDIYTKTNRDVGIFHETREYVAPEFRNVQVPIKGLSQGKYLVEVWDTYKGEVITSKVLETVGTTVTVELPPFIKDIALKIKPAE
jgi:hypothetical protein